MEEAPGFGADEPDTRWFLDDVWRYYFVTENGTVLREGDSPYIHGGHPYVVKCYPLLDGEIHSFVSDFIDQQRFTNRLVTLYDWMLRASAKGVLMIPEESVGRMSAEEMARRWSRFNGVITYRGKDGQQAPSQVTGNASNLGITELLKIQLKMFEDVSGVNATLQGNLATNSVSGTLFNQQTENSLTSLRDLIDSFISFINACTQMDRSLLAQHK